MSEIISMMMIGYSKRGRSVFEKRQESSESDVHDFLQFKNLFSFIRHRLLTMSSENEASSVLSSSAPQTFPTTGLPSALTSHATILPSQTYTRHRIRIGDLIATGASRIGETITVCGWARTIREAGAGSIMFIALNDGSVFDTLQTVVERGVTVGFDSVATAGGTGASFRIVGKVVKSPAKGQEIEIAASEVHVIGRVEDPTSYPLAKKKHSLEYLREMLHLRSRTNTIGAVARIRNACAFATHTFFQERGFLYVHTPIITAADCEGAGEMFQVTTLLPTDPKKDVPRVKDGSIDYKKDFFGKPAMLTVSGQLQVEGYACALSDVYTFGPTFRAEDSHTSRHLAEFWMIEPEIAFATLADDMALAEDYLKFCTRYVLDHCSSDINFFESTFENGLRARLENVVNEPFARLTYTEAIELLLLPEHLDAGNFSVKPYWGLDLGSEHERYLTEKVYKKPVILTNYPKDIKAFYMKLDPDGKTVSAMDILVPKVGEIIGGSQREDNIDVLRKRMTEMNVSVDSLQWYLDLRRFGTVPHAGFGLGFERLVMYVTGIENIRDVIPYPRYPQHAEG
jgi:asparaginyl-tRNA synthetase